jgi:hypothetical protein
VSPEQELLHTVLHVVTGRPELPKPEKSFSEVLKNQKVPMLRWRHYQLSAEQARYWAVELLELADQAERQWNIEELGRESKEERHEGG